METELRLILGTVGKFYTFLMGFHWRLFFFLGSIRGFEGGLVIDVLEGVVGVVSFVGVERLIRAIIVVASLVLVHSPPFSVLSSYKVIF